MRSRWLTIVAGTLLASFGLVASPGAARPAGAIVLGAVNTIAGDQTGYVPVRLEERAVLDFSAFAAGPNGFDRFFREGGPTPAIDIEGGSFAGFMLTDGSESESGPVVLAGTYRNCERRCKPGEIVNVSYPISLGRKMILDPGDYRLFLLTSGDPARVTFRFDRGPDGRTKLRAKTPTHADASTWLARNDLERTLHSSTVAHETFSDAFALSLLVVDGPYSAEGMGVCINEGALPTSLICGPANRFTSRYHAGPVGGRQPVFVFAYVRLDVAAGDWRLGGWYANPTPPDLVSIMTLTADYNDGKGGI